MAKAMMKCGHAANAVDKDGNPICGICYGMTPDAAIIDERTPDLTGRKARCADCGKLTDSRTDLPFFQHRPYAEYDSYYCGCYGWD